ncbi:MAG: HAMP domain-containing sensor histidine kinase [Burkholderiaceae bacterium]
MAVTSEDRSEIVLMQWRSLRSQELIWVVAQLTLAALLFVMLGADIGRDHAQAWLLWFVVVMGVTAGIRYQADRLAQVDPSRALRRFVWTELFQASSWVSAAWMLPLGSPHAPFCLLLVVLALFAGTRVAGAGLHLPSSLVFIVPVLVSVAVRLLTFDEPFLRIIGAGLLFLTLIQVLSLRGSNRMLVAALRSRASSLRLAQRHARRAADEQQARGRAESALALAQHADRDKTRFLAAASHDLRQPVHAIGLFVAALRAEQLQDRPRYLVDRLARSLDGLDELFNRLLDISRLDSGCIQPEICAVPARQVAQTLEARFAAVAAQRNLSLRVRVTPGLVLQTDRHLLVEILTNLLSNALACTRHGGVLLALRGHGDDARIQVWDTGIGIPSDQQGRIFEEFVRLGGHGEAGRGNGLGLGLAIVRRLVAMLDYRLTVRSVEARGSMFELRVPRTHLPAADSGLLPDSAEIGPELAGTMVLVVDDDHDVLAAMVSLLSSWDCYVIAAHSAGEAVDLVSQEARFPDLLITDHRLDNGQTSEDVVSALRAVVPEPLPVVVVSAAQRSAEQRSAEQSAAEFGWSFLSKPVNPSALRAVMAATLARGQPGSRPELTATAIAEASAAAGPTDSAAGAPRPLSATAPMRLAGRPAGSIDAPPVVALPEAVA